MLAAWVLFFFAGPAFFAGYTVQPALAALPTGPDTVQITGTSLHKDALVEAVPAVDLPPGRGAYPGCLDHPEIPVVDYKTDNLPLTDIAIIATCGWQPGETITVTLMDPRGKITKSTVKAAPSKHLKDVYEADVFYQPGVDAPEGKYRFTLQGASARQEGGTLKAKLTFNRPGGARLYAQSGDPFQPLRGAVGGTQRLRLAGFLPGEPVRLLVYQFKGTAAAYYGWQDVTTDRTGQLLVETNLPEVAKDTEMGYFAYGRDTHFVPIERFTPEGYSISRQFDLDLYCPGAQAPRLYGSIGLPNSHAIRAAAGVTKLEIKKQPGFGAQVAASVPGDSPIRVFGYPRCIDHAYWWKVSLSKPVLFGWVSETYLGKYLVEPVEPAK